MYKRSKLYEKYLPLNHGETHRQTHKSQRRFFALFCCFASLVEKEEKKKENGKAGEMSQGRQHRKRTYECIHDVRDKRKGGLYLFRAYFFCREDEQTPSNNFPRLTRCFIYNVISFFLSLSISLSISLTLSVSLVDIGVECVHTCEYETFRLGAARLGRSQG